METAYLEDTQERIQIPCILNRASLGDADYVYVVIINLIDQISKVAWVPRDDLTIEEQQFLGNRLKAKLSVHVEDDISDRYLVKINNSGMEEFLQIQKP